MDEEDWRDIVQLIQGELREIGQSEIADLSHYENREDTERFLPTSQDLVKKMLDALRREMSVRSSTTVQNSLTRLGKLIDEGEPPTKAVVWVDRDRSIVESREPRELLDGDESVPEAVKELENLIGQLAEIDFGRDLQ